MAQSTEARRLQAARAREAFFQQAESDALRHALMLLSSIPALQDLGASTTQACENEAVAGVAV